MPEHAQATPRPAQPVAEPTGCGTNTMPPICIERTELPWLCHPPIASWKDRTILLRLRQKNVVVKMSVVAMPSSKDRDPWVLLAANKASQAITMAKHACEKEWDASEIMELGVLYLWLTEYRLALEHFQRAIATSSQTIDTFYGMAGAAAWCLGLQPNAIELWSRGLTAEYADAAGGVRLPLLLYAASVLDPNLHSLDESKSLLRTKASSPSVKKWRHWPGPLAQYVVGRINDAELIRLSTTEDDDETANQRWEGRFYSGILALEHGDRAVFRRLMQETSSAARIDDPNRDVFLGLVWREELYIARHSAEHPG